MQAVILLYTAPIAAIQCIFADEAESCGDGIAFAFGQYQQQLFGHALVQAVKKVRCQIPLSTTLEVGHLIEAVKQVQLFAADRLAPDAPQADALLLDFFALPAN